MYSQIFVALVFFKWKHITKFMCLFNFKAKYIIKYKLQIKLVFLRFGDSVGDLVVGERFMLFKFFVTDFCLWRFCFLDVHFTPF